MQEKIIIAIDGHSSTGKSSFAKAIATRMGYLYVDTGAMYRAVTLYALRHGFISPQGDVEEDKLTAALPTIAITFVRDADGQNMTCLNGENVEHEIRDIRVSSHVSRVSAIAAVRTHLVHLQQQMGVDKGIVMDGRDIGTVVFPDAEMKIFMTADPHVRAARRYKEMKRKGLTVSFDDVLTNVRRRDYEDENRSITPLRRAPDALLLDNSCLSPEEQMEWLEKQLGIACVDAGCKVQRPAGTKCG
ncbi:MAG: (d)CMP kinase [Prevotellaceae bacterium]|jgi:cytidylate kinase|nr:(d)CMP kinase [Prevotellaceae bacterium]